MEPAPEREKRRTWEQFVKTHWDSLCACDFFSVEVLGLRGTVRCMVFFGERHHRYVVREFMARYSWVS
jgi:hypothetical protein